MPRQSTATKIAPSKTNAIGVNLLVGRNNCGKTSVLEAVELLVSGGSSAALHGASVRRCEFGEELTTYARYGADISHFFYGHRCLLGASFELSSEGDQHRLVPEILSLDSVGEVAERWVSGQRRRSGPNKDLMPALGLRLVADGEQQITLPVSVNGVLVSRQWPSQKLGRPNDQPVHFLGFEPWAMQTEWNKLVAGRRETEIVEAMRILQPEIDSVYFLAAPRRTGILIGQEKFRRLPISSYGGGMRRLLAISIALAATKNGYLLIDEIDTGFHWSVMEDLWRLVAEAAQRSNVQVFATTHSFDCVKGLGALSRACPDLRDSVSIHKLHRSLDHDVCVSGEEIPIAVEQEIEVR